MTISVQRNNVLVESNLQLGSNGCFSAFTGENFKETMHKVKIFAQWFLWTLSFAIVVVPVCFLIGMGLSKGCEKASEIFSRMAGL